MDGESQKRKIRRYLKGSIKDGIDPFCIYQWIERCHYQEWWEMGVALGSHMQPNSLNKDYEKRLEFILSECRRNNNLENKAKDITMRELIESLDAAEAEKDKLRQSFKDLGIDLDIKRKDFERIIQRRPSARKPMPDDDFTGKTVRGFTLFGHTYPVHTHKDAYLKVIQVVFKQNPQGEDRILSLQGRKRKYFSYDPNELTKYRERIPDSDIYAELNENANTLYRRGKAILQLYDMDHGSFEILTD
jgi:hypothetical protein